MSDAHARVFLDANVIAKPVTRTLLMFAADLSDYSVLWSAYAEAEADRHLVGPKKPASAVREKAGQGLSPSGDDAVRFSRTSTKDQQILADAVAGGAQFIITEDVDDFFPDDLSAAGVAAVNPDLFLAVRTTPVGYLMALTMMSNVLSKPHRSPQELHVRLGRQHPRTVVAHKDVFAEAPSPPTHGPPAVLFRGTRCLRCLKVDKFLSLGICKGCQAGPTGIA